MKILSPAGNFESLKMAVYNGADEVYLGINDFNARNNIDGFDIQSLKEAVDFAHIFGVKVCLAINILFSNGEMQSALDSIVDAYNVGVDAFIIQDIGLVSLVKKFYPQIEIHASTQMGLHNLEGVKAVEKFGFKRVVLARETSLNEIKRIRQNSDLEIEYFAQGALCVSFSGNCYLSSYLCNASGNRGRCKQLCRLPYSFEKDGITIKKGYLLSAKDFNMLDRLQDLKQAGVDVLKIEGRARRPFYVAMATKEYYNALNGKKTNEENLKLAFNRNYTKGYFDGNGNIISGIQNHIGVFVGQVEKVVYGKTFNEVFITSNRKLSPKSTFKFFASDKEMSTLSAYDLKEVGNGKYRLTTTQKVDVGQKVHLIVDAAYENEILSQTKRRRIDFKVFAKVGESIKAQFNLSGKMVEVCGAICEQAKKQPITKADLQENFSKSDLFEARLEVTTLDEIFMPKQKLNEFRREVFARIFDELTKSYYHDARKIELKCDYKAIRFEDFQIVESLDEKFEKRKIVYSPSFYELQDIKDFKRKCENEGKQAFLDIPNFALEKDIELLEKIIGETKISIIANNYYALGFNTEIVIGAGLNVYNDFAAEVYGRPIITAEGDVSTKIEFPYMTLRHCPMKSHLGANCAKCPYCDGYSYRMDNGKVLKLKRKKLSSCTFYLTD